MIEIDGVIDALQETYEGNVYSELYYEAIDLATSPQLDARTRMRLGTRLVALAEGVGVHEGTLRSQELWGAYRTTVNQLRNIYTTSRQQSRTEV